MGEGVSYEEQPDRLFQLDAKGVEIWIIGLSPAGIPMGGNVKEHPARNHLKPTKTVLWKKNPKSS